ncbi:hypothetical protein B0T16DRAFT_449470 [Cercophora newfieldiana]|uniref:Uncharacterized protein n=1 Tax=Cercophora newfieldiana TaxID=92897 RepID=A0AA39XRQ9_9PEZI|nr:hypothetical protein B0T16DRAFT_449470 [Cercophora newfieldiana]
MRVPLCLGAIVGVLFAIIPQAQAAHAAEVQCFAPDGSLAPNDTIVPCNNLGITQSGIHSSCCQLLGDEHGRDLCTGTGLCLNNGIVRRGYCTDKTFNNPLCVKVCDKPSAGGNPNGFAEMTSCTDGTYCCGRNNLTCCGTPWAIEPPTVVSSAVLTTITAAAASSSTNTKTLAGLGAALGAVVLLAAGFILYLLQRVKNLKSSLADMSQPLLLDRRPLPSPAPVAGSPGGSPKRLLSSPGLPPGSAGAGEFERLKAMYDNALSQQQSQQSGRQRSGSIGQAPGGGGLDYLFRASELDGTVVQRGAGMPPGGIYEVSGQGGRQPGDGRLWAGSPGLQQQGIGRQGNSMY